MAGSKHVPESAALFRPDCKDCPRLAQWRSAELAARYPGYHNDPVPSFGPEDAALLIVGLAPGLHGANRTGRPFTGDHAGILLYGTLHELGFASGPGSADPDDGLQLIGCRITNAVKCVPPQNKPVPSEVRQCNGYLAAEIAHVKPRAILALGRVAHDAVLMALKLPARDHRFAHHAVHRLKGGVLLFDSYHCSRYNTQTRRLTPAMFRAVLADIASHLRGEGAAGAPV